MKFFPQNILKFLSRGRASFLVLVFCIAAKSLLICFYTYTGKDKIYSLSASYNLWHGKGWTNSFYYANDLNKEILEPFCYWPPGYGLLVSPLQFVFGNDIYASTALFEIFCFIAFLFLCRAILKTQGLSTAWLNISTLLLSFFSHDFIENALGTDLPALDMVLAAFYCLIRTWQSTTKKEALTFGIIAGLCLFLAGFTRYIYIPVALFIAIAVLLLGLWKRNRPATLGFIASAICCIVGLAVAMVWQSSACGSPVYTGVDEKGFFTQNLRYWHPASLAAFVNLNLVPVQLAKATSLSYSSWLGMFNWMNLVMYMIIAIMFCRFFYRTSRLSHAQYPFFLVAGTFLSAAIIGGLALLSLTHWVKYTLSGDSWTFIVEGRYHAFPVVFLQLWVLSMLANHKRAPGIRTVPSWILTLLFVLWLANSIHQVYYTGKVALNYQQMKSASVREQDYVYFEKLLKQTIRDNPGKEVVVASSDKYYTLLASMLGQKGIADAYSLSKGGLRPVRPSILFTVTFAPEDQLYDQYVKQEGVNFLKEVAGTKFYQQVIDPSQP